MQIIDVKYAVNHIRCMLTQFIKFLIGKIRIFPIESLVVSSLSSAIMLLASELWNPLSDVIHIPDAEPPPGKHRPPERIAPHSIQDTFLIPELIDFETAHLIRQANSKIAADNRHRVSAADTETLYQEIEDALLAGQMTRLGYLICLMGHLAIERQEIHAAEVFLQESMDIFMNMHHEPGIAHVNLQLGMLHARNRLIAMTAGRAYDDLQIGRWYLNNGMLDVARDFILSSIDQNLAINRFISVASAHHSLIELYRNKQNDDKARHALLESLRMFASAGRGRQAEAILKHYSGTLIDRQEIRQIKRELAFRKAEFESQMLQVEKARDYSRLYLYYNLQGQSLRAWRFRTLANKYLKQVPKRAMFHRQAGVLGLLYESNRHAELVRDYMTKAHLEFARLDMPVFSSMAKQLRQAVP